MTVQPSQTLMFAYDYYPGRTLESIARLQQSVSRSILGQEIEDDGEIVSDTSEWDTHLAQYQTDGDGGGEYVLVFTRNGQVSDQLQLGTTATFFNDEFNLLEVTVDGDGDDGTPTPEDETPTPEDETPTPEDGTPTPEEGTPTPEEGTPTPEPGGGNGGDGGGNGGAGNGGGG